MWSLLFGFFVGSLWQQFIGGNMQDGLYMVTKPYLCAGFMVKDVSVVMNMCAPILKKKLSYWKTVAKEEKFLKKGVCVNEEFLYF